MSGTLTSIKPRIGFAGVGWIGKSRMQAINNHHLAEMAAAADPDAAVTEQLKQEMPGLQTYSTFEAMLESELEGIVIATPSALHAGQALAALKKGKSVFCQKPLGRNEQETAKVMETARRRDLLLGVDFSYRYTQAVEQVKQTIASGELGKIYGIHLTFHNAYGPDKPWYRDADLSGGGCLMDLGIHLVDLLYWVLDSPQITDLHGRLFHQGKPLNKDLRHVEDYASVQLTLNDDTAVQLSCSWNLPAGKDAIIEAAFYGENGGAAFRNVNGSFYDFIAEKYSGTSAEILAEPPDDWGGRGALLWAEKLAEGNKFDSPAAVYTEVAGALDLIYQNCS
ncbi:MAG: Gfo/Idh/MocA family oxidoreductase [Balneolales bacterium]